MIAHLNELKILGAEIDGKTQVDIVLMSLPESFKTFCLNYIMGKRSYTLAELLNELKVAEGINGQRKTMQVVEKGSILLLQTRKRRRKMLLSRLHNRRSRSPRSVMASRKASASRVVRRDTGEATVQRNSKLRMVITQVCLLLMSLKHV